LVGSDCLKGRTDAVHADVVASDTDAERLLEAYIAVEFGGGDEHFRKHAKQPRSRGTFAVSTGRQLSTCRLHRSDYINHQSNSHHGRADQVPLCPTQGPQRSLGVVDRCDGGAIRQRSEHRNATVDANGWQPARGRFRSLALPLNRDIPLPGPAGDRRVADITGDRIPIP
jgi:hypothetical protein